MYYFLSLHDDQNVKISWSIAIIKSVKDTYEYVIKTVYITKKWKQVELHDITNFKYV